MSTNFTQEQIDNINNYSKEIETKKTYSQAVRETVGQYLGYIGNKGFINMVREIFQNSMDEYMKEESVCNYICLMFNPYTKEVIDIDNGRGIPFDDMVRVFNQPHTSSNYTDSKKPGEFSSGRHGVGSKVVNAVSEYFIAESHVLGSVKTVYFKEGEYDREEFSGKYDIYQGTIIRFKPSMEVMGEITTTPEEILKLIKDLVPLMSIGAKVEFKVLNQNGEISYTEIIENKYGISTGLQEKVKNPVVKPIVFKDLKSDGTMRANLAFTFDSDSITGMEDISSFSNFCPTKSDSTHVLGFVDGVTQFFKGYMNKIFLSKGKNKLSCTNTDIKCSLVAVLDVAHLYPLFSGQAKETLSNEDMYPYMKEVTIRCLDEWSKTHSNELQRLCKFFKELAEIRVKGEKEKVKLSDNYQASVISGMPKKFTKPTGKDHLEFIIMEGDSAVGQVKNYRDNTRQGLFPIRGKLPNAFDKKPSEFLANQEVSAIFKILGAGYGKNFDINKCKWEKVIIGVDADPDGAHIRTLLLKLFLRYALPLIVNGRLYALQPPLYSIRNGNKYKYFKDRYELVRYTQDKFSKQYSVYSMDSKKYTSNELVAMLFNNIDYTHELESIADTFAVEPKLLELCLTHKDESITKLRNTLKKHFRFADVKDVNGTFMVEGLINNRYHNLVFNNRLLTMSKHVLDIIDNAPRMFKVNDEILSLYDLMKIVDSYTPNNLTRYKGLGEMNGSQLMETTLHPDSNRTLLQYTVEDAINEIETIKLINSKKSSIIKDMKFDNTNMIG